MADRDKPSITAPSESQEVPEGFRYPWQSPVPMPTDPAGASDGSPLPQVELPADALSKLAESAAVGQKAYDAAQGAKRKPSVTSNPSEHLPGPDKSLREDIRRAVEEQQIRQQPPTGPRPDKEHAKFNTADLVVLLFCELIAIPLCHAGWDAVVSDEHMARGLVALVIGFPVGLLGGSFHWWKSRVSVPTRDFVQRTARGWLPVTLLVAFGYVAGPEIYRRATKPIAVTGAIGTMPIGTPSVDEAVAQATKTIAAERDEALKSAARAAKERDEALRDLENARQQKGYDPAQPTVPVPTPSGAINWDNIVDPWTTGDTAGTVFLGIGMTGVSSSLVDLTTAYIVSELTGERIPLQISIAPGPQLAQISEVNQIPPKVRIELWAKLDPSLHGSDLLAHWGRFRFHAEYSGVTYEHVFDENYMRSFVSGFPGANVGPHITKKH